MNPKSVTEKENLNRKESYEINQTKVTGRFQKEAPSQSALSVGSVSERRKFQTLADYSDFITLKAGGPTLLGKVRKCAYRLGGLPFTVVWGQIGTRNYFEAGAHPDLKRRMAT